MKGRPILFGVSAIDFASAISILGYHLGTQRELEARELDSDETSRALARTDSTSVRLSGLRTNEDSSQKSDSDDYDFTSIVRNPNSFSRATYHMAEQDPGHVVDLFARLPVPVASDSFPAAFHTASTTPG